MLVVTLCAAPCSWIAVKLKQGREEHEAADVVLKLEGGVTYDYQLDAAGNTKSDARTQTPAWLRSILDRSLQ